MALLDSLLGKVAAPVEAKGIWEDGHATMLSLGLEHGLLLGLRLGLGLGLRLRLGVTSHLAVILLAGPLFAQKHT